MQNLNSSDLLKLGRDIPFPSSLGLIKGTVNQGKIVYHRDTSVQQVVLKKAFRILPGKRLVALAQWQGKAAICKVFFKPGDWKRHVERELFGIRLLVDARVGTPALLQTGVAADGKAAFVLIQFLEEGVSLEELLNQDESVNIELEQKVLALLARSHEFGMWQQDIHLANFMVCQNKIFFLDAADMQVKTRGAALDAESSLRNLAMYLAQFPVSHDKGIDRQYEFYQQCRVGNVINLPVNEFRALVHRARVERLGNYAKKLYRSSTAHEVISSSRQFVVYDRRLASTEFQDFLTNPDAFLERGEIIKDGNSSTVARVEIDAKHYLLKRYNIVSIWHTLKQFFKYSRAHISWGAALKLRLLGIATPEPYMMMEQRIAHIFKRRAYFLCEVVEGENLLTVSKHQKNKSDFWTETFAAFKELFVNMRQYCITHGDLKISNFQYTEGELFVFDLDATRLHTNEQRFWRFHKKDLDRFLKNWTSDPELHELVSEAHSVYKEMQVR